MTKVAIFTTARSDMTFLTPLIKKMNKEAGIQLLLFVGGAHLKKEYGNTINEIKKLKIKITENFDYLFSGSSKKNISKSLSRAHKKIGKIFEKFSFDFVCVIGDRFENLAQISNAIVYNKPIIHIFGGERTEGVIDEQVRHMITKAAHLHFTMCEEYKKNVINMGEQRFRVHNCGSLSIDNIKSLKKITKKDLFKKLKINYEKPVAIFTYHPVTLEKKISTLKQIKNIFQAIKNYDMQFVITAPGHEHEREEINHFIKKKSKKSNKYIYIKSLGFENLFNLLPYCKFVIGNSSSGCIEVPYFKIPTINIGDRQKGRIFHKSLINCGYNTKEIKKSIDKALSPNFVKKIKKMKYKFGGGDASNKIVKIIKEIKLNEKFMNKRLIFN
tara:strand:- start:10 stop:1164 length:1155 start_codon:yes stop_codon:yes gene_type:complete